MDNFNHNNDASNQADLSKELTKPGIITDSETEGMPLVRNEKSILRSLLLLDGPITAETAAKIAREIYSFEDHGSSTSKRSSVSKAASEIPGDSEKDQRMRGERPSLKSQWLMEGPIITKNFAKTKKEKIFFGDDGPSTSKRSSSDSEIDQQQQKFLVRGKKTLKRLLLMEGIKASEIPSDSEIYKQQVCQMRNDRPPLKNLCLMDRPIISKHFAMTERENLQSKQASEIPSGSGKNQQHKRTKGKEERPRLFDREIVYKFGVDKPDKHIREVQSVAAAPKNVQNQRKQSMEFPCDSQHFQQINTKLLQLLQESFIQKDQEGGQEQQPNLLIQYAYMLKRSLEQASGLEHQPSNELQHQEFVPMVYPNNGVLQAQLFSSHEPELWNKKEQESLDEVFDADQLNSKDNK